VELHPDDQENPAALRHALKDVPTRGIGIDSTEIRDGVSPWSEGKEPPSGVPGTPLCRNALPATRHVAHNGAAGLPREARLCLVLPARKEAAGAPSAWSQPFQSTTRATPPMGRRWDAEGGPEGR